MLMDSLLSIASSLVSIGGAIWDYHEAKESAKSATQVEIIRNELIDRREMIEVSKVYTNTIEILREISKFGPTSTTINVRGINASDVAKKVEEYSRFLNEHSNHFDALFSNNAKNLCDLLKQYLEKFADADTFEDRKSAGKEIYYLIENFLPQVKRLLDRKKEAR